MRRAPVLSFVLFALSITCAAAPKPEEPEVPKPQETDWAKVLREAALHGLRALICTDPTAPKPPETAAPSP